MPNPSSPISPHHPGNPMRRHSLPVILVVFALLAFLWSCDQPAGPGESEGVPIFNCLLMASDTLYGNGPDVYNPNIKFFSSVSSSPVAEQLEFRLNGKAPDSSSDDAFIHWIYKKNLFGVYYLPLNGNLTCEMISSAGNARGIITIPEPAIVTSHKYRDSVYADNPLEITWTGNADYYYLRFLFSDGRNKFQVIDSVITNKSFTIVPANLCVLAGMKNMEISIISCNGASVTPGAAGNFEQGIGYLYAIRAAFLNDVSIYLSFIGSVASEVDDTAGVNLTGYWPVSLSEPEWTKICENLKNAMGRNR